VVNSRAMRLLRFPAVLFLVIVALFAGRALYRMERAPEVSAVVGLLESPPAFAGATTPTASGGDLPSVDVSSRPVHVVPPDDGKPARPVTVTGRGGAPDVRAAAPPIATPAVIKGPAKLAAGLSLTIGDRAVELFGVKVPHSGDRCASATQPPGNCADVARGALAARLKGNAAVSCRVPPGQRRTVPAALCVDATGVDLAGFLVAQGFVLADPAQSYEYVGAETMARSQKRGLWRYR
jgi:endonuclease YncB( thermonuclease family)